VRHFGIAGAQLPEKCAANALANPPNPPRVTWPEPDSLEEPEDDWFDEGPALKKLPRDQDPPWPLDEPRVAHVVSVCGNDGPAIPAPFGSQVSRGINA